MNLGEYKPTPSEKTDTGLTGTRTQNQRLKRALLYRLSYQPGKRERNTIFEIYRCKRFSARPEFISRQDKSSWKFCDGRTIASTGAISRDVCSQSFLGPSPY